MRTTLLVTLALVCAWVMRASAGQPEEGARFSTAGQNVSTTVAAPFWLVGTAIAPSKRIAVVVVQGPDKQPIASRVVSEGEMVEGYRVVRIEGDRASFAKEGRTFVVRLGSPLTERVGGPGESAVPSDAGTTERSEPVGAESAVGVLREALSRAAATAAALAATEHDRAESRTEGAASPQQNDHVDLSSLIGRLRWSLPQGLEPPADRPAN